MQYKGNAIKLVTVFKGVLFIFLFAIKYEFSVQTKSPRIACLLREILRNRGIVQ